MLHACMKQNSNKKLGQYAIGSVRGILPIEDQDKLGFTFAMIQSQCTQTRKAGL